MRRDSTAMVLESARERLLPPVEAALEAVLDRRSPPQGIAAARGFPAATPDLSLGACDTPLRAATAATRLPPNAPGHYGMMRYHLGWLDEQLEPTEAPIGKRLRPLICLLAAEACGGDARPALPAAVALELLHNFTLIHDDIEDHDAVRHHRPTVWKLWGEAQGINAGDGMHVLSHLTLLDLVDAGVAPRAVIALSRRVAETCLIITEGQHLDLAFERRDDVSPPDYLDMIARKSAVLLGCAAATGAEIAGAGAPFVDAMETFGHELGMGFQILDDILGIWGDADTTGKPANDLRRRKKTLPSLYALSRAGEIDRAPIRHLFSSEEPTEQDVVAALAALDRTGARRHCEQMVSRYSATARAQLSALPASDAREALAALVSQLEARDR